MLKISNTKLLKVFTTLLILIIIAKLLALVILWYLPSDGIELNAKNSYQAKYQRVDFKNMLIRAKVIEEKKTVKNNATTTNISDLVLKGLYGSKLNGFAIVAKKSAIKKTTILSIGESYEGYKLKEIESDKVFFSKGAKSYMLSLEISIDKVVSKVRKNKRAKRVLASDGEAEEHSVTKKDIKYYSSAPSKIWKDIAIAPVKRNGRITGFKVNRIKSGSKMSLLGLKKGDVIIKANNVQLSSFRDAIKLYKNIDKIDTIELVVIRNNQEKEIIYEIR